MESEKKLHNRFKAISKKYQSYCINNGYASKEPLTLLWYFNRSGHARKNGQGYFVSFRDQEYRPEDIISYFAIPKNNNK